MVTWPLSPVTVTGYVAACADALADDDAPAPAAVVVVLPDEPPPQAARRARAGAAVSERVAAARSLRRGGVLRCMGFSEELGQERTRVPRPSRDPYLEGRG